jgi:PPOX class probable F420-dependent enzyme
MDDQGGSMDAEEGHMDEKVRALLRGPNFAHVATVRPNGSAAVTPMWVDLEGDLVLLNGMPGRAWPRNLIRDPRVTICVSAVDNPYECATLRGRALEPTTGDAAEQFHQMMSKYRPEMPTPPGTQREESQAVMDRILFRVVVEKVLYQWQPGPGADDEYIAWVTEMMSSMGSASS